MSGGRQVELHYINTGFPYTVTESFMNLFEGLTYGHTDSPFSATAHEFEESAYWPMHSGTQKYAPWGTSYYSRSHTYDVDDLLPRLNDSRRTVEISSAINSEPTPVAVHGGSSSTDTHENPEECIRSYHNGSSSQVIWQDNVDPDNMTYEELLDLGEAVGTHSRGLSKDLIKLLPVTKYKSGFFFSRRKSQCDRCVICQMKYKRGEKQITLPCKHAYHTDCGTKWLSINKACPICYTEVFGEKSKS
ncbi:RING-type E3 ubiquitin transferase [Ranunculus cassubicifolius]